MHPEEIKKIIESSLKDSTAHVTGDGRHFNAIVISQEFANKSRIQKQQLVYAPLNAKIADGSLHAISIKTFTPDEWQQQENE
jgi:acid stress-induced BolA-like protein IbaG/YrbA